MKSAGIIHYCISFVVKQQFGGFHHHLVQLLGHHTDKKGCRYLFVQLPLSQVCQVDVQICSIIIFVREAENILLPLSRMKWYLALLAILSVPLLYFSPLFWRIVSMRCLPRAVPPTHRVWEYGAHCPLLPLLLTPSSGCLCFAAPTHKRKETECGVIVSIVS